MKSKVFAVVVLGHLLLATKTSAIPTGNESNITIIDGTLSNSTVKQIVGGEPIVIHTQLQHYDQPTLKEYQECHENLEKCKNVCQGVEHPVECLKECPICPLLIKEEIVVQGINDTDYRPAAATPINMTNIIRLTNQIQNIIENHQGNITYHNENVVHVHQNISRTGGKFGLGYNNTDPCCIVVRSSRSCESKRFSTGAQCHHKRHRVCGKQCESRVMLAKRVIECEEPASAIESDDYIEENCHETIKYVPYHVHKRRVTRSGNKCISIPSWPYVLCGHNMASHHHSICKRCLTLTYYYILQHGIPAQCRKCFMVYNRPSYEMYYPWYPVVGNDFEFGDDFDLELGGWRHDKTKCRLPNGDISEDCNNNVEGSGTESSSTTEDPWYDMPEAQEEILNNYVGNGYDEFPRRRRHTFIRSKYSRRQM